MRPFEPVAVEADFGVAEVKTRSAGRNHNWLMGEWVRID